MATLNVDGSLVHYIGTGAGPATLVLVHGAGGTAATWTRQLEGLAPDAVVIAVDLPGHGGSPVPGRSAVAEYAAVMRGFVDALGRGPVVLGGHSMGGAVAQAVALEAPDRVRGLVLVGSGGRLRVLPELLDLLGRDYPRAVAAVNELAWSPAALPGLVEGGRRAMLETPGPVTLADFAACDAFDVLGRLGEIRCPTLVVVGDDDRMTPPRYAEHLARGIAGARLVRVPRAGHFVMLEEPDQVNQAIRAFLRDLG